MSEQKRRVDEWHSRYPKAPATTSKTTGMHEYCSVIQDLFSDRAGVLVAGAGGLSLESDEDLEDHVFAAEKAGENQVVHVFCRGCLQTEHGRERDFAQT